MDAGVWRFEWSDRVGRKTVDLRNGYNCRVLQRRVEGWGMTVKAMTATVRTVVGKGRWCLVQKH